jgi:hypothetical protein
MAQLILFSAVQARQQGSDVSLLAEARSKKLNLILKKEEGKDRTKGG